MAVRILIVGSARLSDHGTSPSTDTSVERYYAAGEIGVHKDMSSRLGPPVLAWEKRAEIEVGLGDESTWSFSASARLRTRQRIHQV
jgi:hypothetical protein